MNITPTLQSDSLAMTKKTILFLSNSYGHRKVLDRVESATAAGYSIHLICYDKYDTAKNRELIQEKCSSIQTAGSPRNGASMLRILNWFQIFKLIKNHISVHGEPDILIANSAELLAFASLCLRGNFRRIYDLADIHKHQYKNNLIGFLFRKIEKISLKKNWEIAVTSPWFYWEYLLKNFNCKNSTVLIENKLSPSEAESLKLIKKNQTKNHLDPIVIGWTGMLRCSTSLSILIDLTTKNPGKYSIHLIGTTNSLNDDLLKTAKNNKDIQFKGEYTPETLAEHLSKIDFMWLVDMDDGINSKLLLPNRLYQAVAAGIPGIAHIDSATGKVVNHYKIGLTVKKLTAEAIDNIITTKELEDIRNQISKIRAKTRRGDEFSDLFRSKIKESEKIPKTEDPSITFRE